MAALSIFSKEWLYRITRRVGEKLNSQVVIANAWHHRSDAYSSVLALISIGLAMAVPGFLAADPAAGMLVAGMIAMTGAEIMGESVKQLTDAVTDEELVREVETIASADADIRNVTRVRARQVGSSALVDVEVTAPPDFSASAMRAIEERVRVRILSDVSGVLDNVVFCPLLSAIEDSDAEHQMSATEVEYAAREILEADSDVKSVEGVTVHYQDTVLIRVDANICVCSNSTVSEANSVAARLRENLLNSHSNIDQANIFLDLNVPTRNNQEVLSP
jgi:divalent metal cation (Fe/Co/Zn/Cd) transporter